MSREHSGFEVIEINDNFYSGRKEKRDCFKQIERYIKDTTHQSKICAIYGLRETGKTILLKQAAEMLNTSEKAIAVYIKCFEGADFYDIVQYIKVKIEKGYKYFFIDEITCSTGFSRIGSILSDKFVKNYGAKIIVTSSDSLEILLTSKAEMYDKIEFVSTTYISFEEYSRITGITTLDDYIKKGCTLKTDIFETRESTEHYIETAIANNIIHSLKNYEGVDAYPPLITEKYSEEAIKSEIKKIINRYSQIIIYQAINTQFKTFEGISNLNYKEANTKIAEILGCNTVSGIEDKDIAKIHEYLCDIGVFQNIPDINSDIRTYTDEPLEMIVYPGMIYSNIKYTLQELNGKQR